MTDRSGSIPELRSPNIVTTLAREFRGSYAFIERNLFLVKRYWGWEFAFLIYAIAGALSITFIGKEQGNEQLLLSLMIGAIFCTGSSSPSSMRRWMKPSVSLQASTRSRCKRS